MLLVDTNPMAASFVEQGEWQGYRQQGANVGVSYIVPIIEPQLLTGATRALEIAKSTKMMNILAEASVNGVLGGGQAFATQLHYSGDAGDLGPNLKGLEAGGLIPDGWNVVAAEQEEVVDPVVGGREALRLAG